ncbi:helix-turn-helix domain-containing protein [Streptomyces flaveolus]|uniref:Helix-turn-helix domain-containing protein n=1 Tax=Streptomyces flaveolus TaxID=67297 RepID=A0ABV3A7J5_9ACTN
MSDAGWPEERWAVLGEEIAKARRALGWDQQELAARSGNSPNTISNYERGRATRSRRIPAGVDRVAFALGWSSNVPRRILAGEDPRVVLPQVSLFDLTEEAEGQARAPFEPTGPMQYALMGPRDIELVDSGHIAQDTFVRQMKRYRKLLGVSVEELANRVSHFTRDLPLKNLMSLESGTRSLRMHEAEAIAKALDTTTDWLLTSGLDEDAPEEMRWPPNDEELAVEAKAVERRIFEVASEVNHARNRYAQARELVEAAHAQADMAAAFLDQVSTRKAELERNYQYLLGRIDSLRAAKGQEPIFQASFEVGAAPAPGSGQSLENDGSLGEKLSEARRRAGMTEEEVSSLTRVRPSILQAVERDQFALLGGDVYARGYIRALSRAYDIDADPLIEQYEAQHGAMRAAKRVDLFQADSSVRPRRRLQRRKGDEDQ